MGSLAGGLRGCLDNEETDMKKTANKSGFTLVELMVVAVIVAILAGVAIPLMSANKKRAMATEAQAALGTVRSALRAMYAETGTYTLDLNGDPLSSASAVTDIPGIGVGDLQGRYFSENCYTFVSLTSSNYLLRATGNDSTADQAAEVGDVVVELDDKGSFRVEGL
jgi:prepilin-type N-terminal cleavage/methylation domain-containing protein